MYACVCCILKFIQSFIHASVYPINEMKCNDDYICVCVCVCVYVCVCVDFSPIPQFLRTPSRRFPASKTLPTSLLGLKSVPSTMTPFPPSGKIKPAGAVPTFISWSSPVSNWLSRCAKIILVWNGSIRWTTVTFLSPTIANRW